MLSSIPAAQPKLAPPGAGLPKFELVIAKLIFRWGRWRTNRSQAVAQFARYREEVLDLVRDCSSAAGEQRVLIRRLPGLEDSSRFWSVFMTLDHLRIVHDSISGVIASLVAGQRPPGVVRTADVKPGQEVGIAVVAAFEESCRKFEQSVAASPDLATAAKHPHPWFGPLDAGGWHFMAGFHLKLHRQQIERILAGVAKAR